MKVYIAIVLFFKLNEIWFNSFFTPSVCNVIFFPRLPSRITLNLWFSAFEGGVSRNVYWYLSCLVFSELLELWFILQFVIIFYVFSAIIPSNIFSPIFSLFSFWRLYIGSTIWHCLLALNVLFWVFFIYSFSFCISIYIISVALSSGLLVLSSTMCASTDENFKGSLFSITYCILYIYFKK